MTQPEDPYTWPTPPPRRAKVRRKTDDGDLVQDHSAVDFGQLVDALVLRVLGRHVRADESLLDRPDELAELGREEVFGIAGDHVLIDYELNTGGAPSKNSMGHAGLIGADDLDARIEKCVVYMQGSHITNDEHREVQSRRGRIGGKRSRRKPAYTLSDFYPVAHLTRAEQMQALGCSESTVKRLRRQYRDTIGELPVATGGSDKPINPPEGEQQELPAIVQQVEDTPQYQLTQFYNHEDEPQEPDFLSEYTYEHLLFLKHSQKLRNMLRQAQMTDEDMILAQHWAREDYASRPPTEPDAEDRALWAWVDAQHDADD